MNDDNLIYVFSRNYMSFKKAQELAENLNSLKSEYSEEFVVSIHIFYKTSSIIEDSDSDIDNRVVCGKVTTEDWNNLNLEQHNFVKLIKLENK